MKPSQISNRQDDLFQSRLSEILNPREPFFVLSHQLPWDYFEEEFSLLFSGYKGQPPKPIRLMVGLLMIQHMENLSDEAVVERWVQNPYWQFFCGYDFLQWKCPIDPSSLVRWRKRLGPEGLDKILCATIHTAVHTQAVKKKDLERVIADTTVMETNTAYPTDSRLLNEARKKLVKQAKDAGLSLRQSYKRVGDRLAWQVSRYAHAKQFKRMKKGVKKLKTLLGRTIRDIERQIAGTPSLQDKFCELLELSHRLLGQTKESSDKLYSLHAPHTQCISKGKAHKRYEFGTKVSLLVTHKQGLALSSRALKGNPYDGHTLKESLEHAEGLTFCPITRGFVDKGYRKHGVEDKEIFMSGQKKGMTRALRNQLKRRSAIEPHIGHMKSEGKLRRNMLKGFVGDQMNAILCAIGHNLRLILNHIKLIFMLILKMIRETCLRTLLTSDNQRLIAYS